MAAQALSRDSLEYERRGRLLHDRHYEAAIRARAREVLRLELGGLGGGATRTPAIAKGVSRETVLKVISWTKSRHAPLAQARYAARTRDMDPPEQALEMINEHGTVLRGTEVAREIEGWGLKADHANLSAAARKATSEQRAAMPKNERLDRRQAAHLIFSIPAQARTDAATLKRAVDGALAETFGAAGHRYVYTIHTDHSARPHAHIIVKAQSEPQIGPGGRKRSTQLRLNPRELEGLRHVFTCHAQERGLNVVATRREDRGQLRADILAGTAPLRENVNLHQATKQTRQGKTFERYAPQWYSEHGLGYERRRLAAAAHTRVAPAEECSPNVSRETFDPEPARGLLGRVFGKRARGGPAADAPSSGPENSDSANSRRGGYFENFANYRKGSGVGPPAGAAAKIAAHFAATHREPERAAESFGALFREAPRLALWAANNHPIAFGEPAGRIGPGIAWRDVRELADPADRGDRSVPQASRARDPILAGERAAVREQTQRARRQAAADRAAPTVARSLQQLAGRIELETPADPEGKEKAAHIRMLARDLNAKDLPTREQARDQAQRIAEADKEALGRELEDQLQRRDAARGRRNARERDDGGRER